MEQLEMIEAFAELDGVEAGEMHGKLWVKDEHGCFSWNGYGHKEYNPITDYALTFEVQIKYKIRIMGQKVYIDSMKNKSTVVCEDINNPLVVAHSIIEVILKHNNLWSEK